MAVNPYRVAKIMKSPKDQLGDFLVDFLERKSYNYRQIKKRASYSNEHITKT